MAGRLPGVPNKDKPFRDALRLEIAEAGEDRKALRKVAAALLNKAQSGDIPAIKEVADRLDGKVPQAITGDDDSPGIKLEFISDEQRAKAIAAFVAKTRAK